MRSSHPDSSSPSRSRRIPGVIRVGAAFALALDVTIARRAFGRRLVDVAPTSTTRSAGSLVVNRVDDPNGRMRLLAARGPVDSRTIGQLAAALGEMAPGGRLHLDLSDAELSCVGAMHRLEQTVDDLELRGVRVRIVGVDPEHPALVPPRR